MRWGAVQGRVPEVDKTVPTRSGGSQADPERILGSLENPKSLQNRTFEARFEILAPKMASERVSGDTSKNP